MIRAKWLAIQAVERLGWQGVLGLLILAGVIALQFLQIQPLRQKADDLRIAAAGKNAAATQGVSRGDLATFKAAFKRGSLEEQLKDIHEAGKTTGLGFKRIEYRMLEETRSGLRQYQIIMPVTSTYPNIRKFTSRALATVPGLSLDYVNFQRKTIGAPTIDAELRFTLFLADPA